MDLPLELHNKIIYYLSIDDKIKYYKAFGVEPPPKLYYDRIIDDINKRIKETKDGFDRKYAHMDFLGEIRLEEWFIVLFVCDILKHNYDYIHRVASFFENIEGF